MRSEHRTAQNDKFSPLVRGALTGFPVSKLHISPGQKKTDIEPMEKIRVYGKYFSYRMLNIHKRKKCLSDALKQPFQKADTYTHLTLPTIPHAYIMMD
ncbi:hypothetical protein, partial [Escherichia coli]|uniref:hypothetical protein n=1 Tax=Escherichia coli TaxID=562 RepID=UPI001BFED957